MVHRREGIIIVNICGTLMCQEVLFPWHFCASLPLSLITTLRSIRLSAPLRSRENFGTPRRITQLISEGARMEAGLLALSYHALPPPYESTISITDKTWRLFLLMQHAFPIICEMEKKLQARFSNEMTLHPYSLSSSRQHHLLMSEKRGILLNTSHLERIFQGLYDHASASPSSLMHSGIVIGEILPILLVLCLHGPSFFPHPPAQVLPFLQGQLTGHFKKAHIVAHSLPPCSGTV